MTGLVVLGRWSITHEEGSPVAGPRALTDPGAVDGVGGKAASACPAGSRGGGRNRRPSREPGSGEGDGPARADPALHPRPERPTPCRSGPGSGRRRRQCRRALARGRPHKAQSGPRLLCPGQVLGRLGAGAPGQSAACPHEPKRVSVSRRLAEHLGVGCWAARWIEPSAAGGAFFNVQDDGDAAPGRLGVVGLP